MRPDRKLLRDRYAHNLEHCMRIGDWSLEKYDNNEGWVVYHWVCGFWTHTFYNNTKNQCGHCTFRNNMADFPDEIEHLYRLINFDLMNSQTWNASVGYGSD